MDNNQIFQRSLIIVHNHFIKVSAQNNKCKISLPMKFAD